MNKELFEVIQKRCADLFIQDGQLMRRVDMRGRGSDVDEVVAHDLNDPNWIVEVAFCRLEQQIEPLCSKTGNPHRFRRVPAHDACVDCNLHK
jgi:hypothetical protein